MKEWSKDDENREIKLSDDRRLSYARYGVEGGRPVFYFTGGNSARFEGRWFAQAAQAHGIDLIVPDRPGFGGSDFQPGRRFVDWPKDVSELADALGIGEFAVVGLSGGAPHVAAVAAKLPTRVSRAAIVSGVAPPEMSGRFVGMWFPVRLLFFFARWCSPMSRFFLRQMGAFYADRENMLKRMKQALPAPDVALIDERPEVMEIFSASAMEAHRNGIDGDAWEWRLYVRPWGFQLEEISTKVGLWYGTVDRNAPVGMGRYLARHLPDNELHVVEDGGHFSTINRHIGAIFKFLKGTTSD